ncbi:MAG: nucleoside transporter C-terminal domain-containing protein [Coriobacteriia bacterium]|nr:nucleoside transporter C-terminal domain-containing protein [Coriobacteriia bacterium]
MCLVFNIVGIAVFLGIAFVLSKKKKKIPWISVGLIIALNLILSWFFLTIPAGQAAIQAATDGFTALVNASYDGVRFAFGDAFNSIPGLQDALNGAENVKAFVFFASALLPVIVIVPLFDILTYFGILPFIIKWVGKAIAVVTRRPKFEAFFAIEMMFLGNTEVIAASRFQIVKLSKQRCLTIAMMSMSCVTASLIGAYTQMMPGKFILTAIPLNVLNALMVAAILNPYDVSKKDDEIATLYEKGQKKEPFFSYLGNSILNSGKLVLIIVANVIAFVGLASIINLLLGLFNPLIHMTGLQWDLSLENLLGLVMYIPACLLGLPIGDANTMELAKYMGTKLVTNEFVVMGQLQPIIADFGNHFQCVTTVFLTSFANFSTVGMIIGCFKGMVGDDENDHISKNVLHMFVAGILVSCLSAAIAGLWVW